MNIDIKGKKIVLENKQLHIGELVPDFKLAKLVGTTVTDVSLFDLGDKIKIFSTFPSIDTGVCDLQVRNFNKEFASRSRYTLVNVSADLPFAFNRWCGAAGIDNILLLSDYRDHSFGKDFGINIKYANILYRTVFVLNQTNHLIYIQYAKRLGEPLDLEDLKAFLETL